MSRRPFPWPLLLVGLALSSALLFFYLKTRDYDAARYFDEISLVHQLKELDANWARDVLRAKVGMTQDYDGLADPLPALAALPPQLGRLAGSAAWSGRPELAASVARYQAALAQKTELVEAFKSHDAVLRNSLAFLPQARDDLEPLLPRALRQSVLAVLLDGLEFAEHGAAEEAAELATGIKQHAPCWSSQRGAAWTSSSAISAPCCANTVRWTASCTGSTRFPLTRNWTRWRHY
jgi:two-component system, NtrC family, sensor kinase